jgi:hypothetical protein
MASGPGRVLADGEAQVERYLLAEGFTKEEIEDALDLATETTPSYVIVGTRPDALYSSTATTGSKRAANTWTTTESGTADPQAA